MSWRDHLKVHQDVLQNLKLNALEESGKEYYERRKNQFQTLQKFFVGANTPPSSHRVPVVTPNDGRRNPFCQLGWKPEQKCELVPIKLDIDSDGYKLRDSFF